MIGAWNMLPGMPGGAEIVMLFKKHIDRYINRPEWRDMDHVPAHGIGFNRYNRQH